MSSIENVTCPRCGSTISTTTSDGRAVEDDRLKGTTAACGDCESTIELYYY